MSKLTPAGMALLEAVAASNRAIQAPDSVHPITVAALIKRGLLSATPMDGAPSRLMLTDAGRETARLQQSIEGVDGLPAAAAAAAAALPVTEPQSEILLRPGVTVPDGKPNSVKPPGGKLATLVTLLRRPQGASLDQMTEATGWQAHSVRGAMSGGIKKGLGLAVLSEKTAAGRVYRIAAGRAS